jgi:hypothetical protein
MSEPHYKTPAEIVQEITEAAPTAVTPPELKARLEDFANRNIDAIRSLRIGQLAMVMEWMKHLQEAGETDRELMMRMAAWELCFNSAFLARTIYRDLGRPPSGGRFAMTAYAAFEHVEHCDQIAEDYKAAAVMQEAFEAGEPN